MPLKAAQGCLWGADPVLATYALNSIGSNVYHHGKGTDCR